MIDAILTLNTGSTSLKASLWSLESGGPEAVLWSARLETARDGMAGAKAALEAALAQVKGARREARVIAVGHRIVHGGLAFKGPARLDAAALERLATLKPLAPEHQPHNLAGVAAAAAAFPDAVQTGSFDTAFHAAMPEIERLYALPHRLMDRGFVRYGFHGLSYASIARRLPALLGPSAADARVIVAHLGGGSSLCAMRGGISQATTMGFTALDGPPMATRCGALDPGLVLHLLEAEGFTPETLADALYDEAGLKGVSGLSGDMRDLLASDTAGAKRAVALFVHCIAGEIGRLAAALGGLDALVFTAGIGENAAPIRAEVAARCAWLGAALDPAANAANATRFSTPDARVSLWRVETDEESEIAREAFSLL